MFRSRAWAWAGALIFGVTLIGLPAAVASASMNGTDHHHGKTHGHSNVGSLHCPKHSLVTTASGTTFTGPSANNGGTAGCIYNDAAGGQLTVVFEMPNESKSQFVAKDPGDIGKPAQPVRKLGEAAFSTLSYGRAEVDVYESSSKGFGVSINPPNGGTPTAADLMEVEAVAHAIAG
jgi:hypothetical protein